MGLIDQIAEKASEKIAQKAAGQTGENIQALNTTAGPDNPHLALNSKTTGNSGQSSSPAEAEMGLKESDVAPGGPAVAPDQSQPGGPPPIPQVPIPQAPAAAIPPQPTVAVPTPEVIGQGKTADPVKEAATTPNFWQSVLDVAGKTGKGMLELLGDFAAGYSHQQSSPTEQRLAREHDLRMQGAPIQAQKDLMSINQGFQAKQAALDREFQDKWNSTTDANVKAQLKQQHDYQSGQLSNERQQITNSYMLESMMKRFEIGQGVSKTGGVTGLFGGD